MILALAAALAVAAGPADTVRVRLGQTVTLTIGAAGAETLTTSGDTDQRMRIASRPLCHGAPAPKETDAADLDPLPADQIEVTYVKEWCSSSATIIVVRNGYSRAVTFTGVPCADRPRGLCRIGPREGSFGEWRVYPEIELRAFAFDAP